MRTVDKITFDRFEWRVLDIQNDAALLITEDIVEVRAYNDAYKDIAWVDCEMRKYLNDDFLGLFGEMNRSKILRVTNKNPDNPWYGSKGGADTQDSIFLLSIEELACQYFGNSSANLNNPGKNQRYWFQRKDENNSKRRATYEGSGWWWWLWSPGRLNVKAVYVHGDGNIGIQGNNILKCNINSCFHPITRDHKGGVRPALWLNMK